MVASSLVRTRRLRLTARGWATLAAGVACLLLAYPLGRHELLLVAGFALALSLGGLLVARLRRPKLEVIRLFSPPVVEAGSSVQLTLRIRNAGSVTTPPLRVEDAIPWHPPGMVRELDRIRIGTAAARTTVIRYTLTPERRGLFPIGPLVVEYSDPFGMTRASTAVGDADRLTVVPAVTLLPDGGPVLIDGDGAAQLVQRRSVGNDDDQTTREYRVGDALRRVHWRASARHGELMVRQEEHRSHPDARIVVDTRMAGYPDAAPDHESWPPAPHSERFEWAVRMLASLAVHLDQNGFRVEVVEPAPAQVDAIGEAWEGGLRSESFLTSLASLRLLDRIREAPQAPSDATGPLFAILADPDDDVVEWVLRQRRPGQSGAVFAIGMRQDAAERFADAGWLRIDVTEDDDPGDAWRLSAVDTGVARGPR